MWTCKNCKRTNGDAFIACHCGVGNPGVKAEPKSEINPKPKLEPEPKADK